MKFAYGLLMVETTEEVSRQLSFFIFLYNNVKEGMMGMVLDPKFRVVSVTGCEVSSEMRTVTSQTAAYEESELMLRQQLQALCSLWSKFETLK
jgi:hypothetical protein